MADTVQTPQLQPFTTVKYTTKDGENITATKKDGVVTLVGDKNGVRQVPVEDFVKKELAQNAANVKLENSPEKDTVEISSKKEVQAKPEGAKPAEAAPASDTLQTPAAEPKKLDVVA